MHRKLTSKTRWRLALAACVAVAQTGVAIGDELPARAASRGELLYSTHCIACHNEQVHWRDKKRVNDLTSLRAEVTRWQQMMNLRWDRNDVDEVADYLQATYYPQTRNQ